MKNIRETLKRHWLVWALLALIAVGFGWLAVGEFQRWWTIREEIVRTEGDIVRTEERIEELSGELALVTDPAYLEKEARHNLNLKREGEEVFAVVGLDAIKREEHFTLSDTSPVEEEPELWENIKSWWSFFFR